MDEEVKVQWLQIPRLFVLIGSENVAVMLAVVTTPVAGPVGGVALGSGSVFIITTVGGREPPKPSLRPKVSPEPSW